MVVESACMDWRTCLSLGTRRNCVVTSTAEVFTCNYLGSCDGIQLTIAVLALGLWRLTCEIFRPKAPPASFC